MYNAKVRILKFRNPNRPSRCKEAEAHFITPPGELEEFGDLA